MSPTSEFMAGSPLSPIRNPFELRGLCRRSYFRPRTCVRSINHFSSKCVGLSIRVSPSHLYNAGRAGLGWGGDVLPRNHLQGPEGDSGR
jgi:hypothetical protein